MTHKAQLELTGFIGKTDPATNAVQVGNIWVHVATTDGLYQGDLVSLKALLSERGTWSGSLQMHLSNRASIATAGPISEGLKQEAVAAPVAPPPQQQATAPQPAAAVASTPAPTAPTTSRAARFNLVTKSTAASAPAAPRPAAPAPAPAVGNGRPTFKTEDEDVPF